MNELQILAQRAKDLRKEEKLEAITKAQEYRDWLNSIRKAKSWKGWKKSEKISEESGSNEEEQSQQSCEGGCHVLWDKVPLGEEANGMMIEWHEKNEKEVVVSSTEKARVQLAKTPFSGTYNLKVSIKIPVIESFEVNAILDT